MRAVTRTTLSFGDLLEVPIGLAAATGSVDPKLAAGIRAGTEPEPDEPEGEQPEPEQPEGDEPEPDAAEDTGPVYVQGVKVGDRLLEIPASELEWAKASTKLERVEVLESIDYRRVPTDRLVGSFWVQPDPGFEKPLATLMKAMIDSHRALVVKFALKSRQRLGIIRPRATPSGFALLANVVTFQAEWRAPDERVLAPGELLGVVDPRAVQHARTILDDLKGTGRDIFDSTTDDYVDELDKLVTYAAGGLYDDAENVLRYAAKVQDEDGLTERAARLREYALDRWPREPAEVSEAEQPATPAA
jgi:hypothetical protein